MKSRRGNRHCIHVSPYLLRNWHGSLGARREARLQGAFPIVHSAGNQAEPSARSDTCEPPRIWLVGPPTKPIYLEISRQQPLRAVPISVSFFSTRPTGPERLIAAIADPVRSKMGPPTQATPGSLSSRSNAQPRCRTCSSSFFILRGLGGVSGGGDAVSS